MAHATPRPELMALLAAVKDEPDDDTPKFALADWLQEQDDEADRARGEFVRYVTQYHRAGEEPPGAWKLRDQFLALWEHYHPAWLRPLSEAGFEFPLHVGNTYARGPLLTARVNGYDVTSQQSAALAATETYAWVARLELHGMNSRQLTKFAASQFLEPLSALTLSDCIDTPEAISTHPSRLRSLLFVGSRLGDAGFKALCDSPHLNRLRSLTVGRDSLSIHAARAFADRTGLPALTELDLGGSNRIGPDGVLIMVTSKNTGRLRKLNLDGNGIADYGVEAICRQSHMSNLTHLDVSGNLLSDRSAFALAQAPHLNSLEQLLLTRNAIGDDGALALARSPHLTNLRWLSLMQNPIGAGAADALRERFGRNVVF